MEHIRVLVADDHPVFRHGMRAMLGAETGIELVAEATDGEEAIARTLEMEPDVVLMDLNMPKTNGIEAARRILEARPDTAVLMLTMFEDDDSVFAAMRAGAHGYVLKGADGEQTIRAIRSVAGGEAIFSPGIARRLVQYFAKPRQKAVAEPQAFPELTDREHDILTLIARGYTNTAIADRLYLSPKPCATTSQTSSPSSRWRIVRRLSSGLVRRGSEGGRFKETDLVRKDLFRVCPS